MTLDVIICTYNRSHLLSNLLHDLSELVDDLDQVIVVDSSNDPVHSSENQKLVDRYGPKFIRLSSKLGNQPFQRILGAMNSGSDVISFFDDDVRILDKDLFGKVRSFLQIKNSVGVSSFIKYWHDGYSNLPGGLPKAFGSFLSRVLTNRIKPGQISFNGIVNPDQPQDNRVEYFKGPFMVFRRNEFLKSFTKFDYCLLDSFTNRLGGGEDKYLSLGMLNFGQLYRIPEELVSHPNTGSTYGGGPLQFYSRIVFSRLLLNQKICQIMNKSRLKGSMAFFLHNSFMLFSSLIGVLFRPSRSSWAKYKGYSKGLWTGFRFLLGLNVFKERVNWTLELSNGRS